MHDELVTIATFNNAAEMGIVRSKLEDEGIECFLNDELVTQTYVPNVAGGMKLKVHGKDAGRASEIVKNMGVFKEPRSHQSRMAFFDRVTSRLPLLGSLDLVIRFFAFLVLLAVILAVVYMFFVVL